MFDAVGSAKVELSHHHHPEGIDLWTGRLLWINNPANPTTASIGAHQRHRVYAQWGLGTSASETCVSPRWLLTAADKHRQANASGIIDSGRSCRMPLIQLA